MGRREELEKLLKPENLTKASVLVDEILFLEERLAELKKLPFLKVNPNNPDQQKATPAAKQYKELLQQYNNSLKVLFKIVQETGTDEEDSPLRAWVKARKDVL